MTKAVITVIGVDKTGIIANVSNLLYENEINILDISQTIMQEMFCMIMLVDLDKSKIGTDKLTEMLNDMGKRLGVSIRIQLEEVFQSMHRI